MLVDEKVQSPPLEKNGELQLRPKTDALVQSFLASKQMLELSQAFGSPLNIMFPELLGENLSRFQTVFDKHRLKGRIYFAHKANRADSVPRTLALQNSYIDVSSLHELRHALGSGFNAQRIQATGPKNSQFLTLCLQHNIVVAADCLQELQEIVSLRQQLGCPTSTNLLLRVCGFKDRQGKYRGKASRFGIAYSDIELAFNLLEEHANQFNLLGFSFHLDTVSPLEKSLAVESCFSLIEEAIDRGFEPSVLNVGGGFKVNYLDSAGDWHAYTAAIREAALGSRQRMTWQGNTFGLLPEKGVLRGSFNSYSYYESSAGSSFLNEIIEHQIDSLDGMKIGRFLRENGLELWIEPGRALLEQVGITVATVMKVRPSSQGETLVCLNMKRQDVCFLDQEIFVDPIIIYGDEDESCTNQRLTNQRFTNQPSDGPQQPFDRPLPVYFAGNLCLESDLITRHQVWIPRLPKPGDMVAFLNTAGYFMDFSASEAIMHPIANKVAAFRDKSGFAWTLDENYDPLRRIQ